METEASRTRAKGGGIFQREGRPTTSTEEETFRLGHYGFHVCVYSPRFSYNISFSWIFNFFWHVLVWRSFVFLWSKICRAYCISCSVLVHVLWFSFIHLAGHMDEPTKWVGHVLEGRHIHFPSLFSDSPMPRRRCSCSETMPPLPLPATAPPLLLPAAASPSSPGRCNSQTPGEGEARKKMKIWFGLEIRH